MSKIEIFPKVLGKYKLDHPQHLKLKEQCFKLLEKVDEEKYSFVNRSSDKLKHFFNKSNQNLLYLREFEWFEEWITEKSIDYIENTLGYYLKDGVMISDCWLNVCSKGGEQGFHCHSNSYISGTYYVNYTKRTHSPLCFTNKDMNPENNITQHFEIPIEKPSKYNSKYAVMDHDEGDLLLWQSNLNHGYFENGENNRISISFNVMPKYIHNISYGFKIERDVPIDREVWGFDNV